MAAKKSSKSSTQEEVQVESRSSNRRYTGAPMAEFLDGYPHTAVLCINPKWDTNEDGDRWHFILPVDDKAVVVRTNMKGFVPKSDLRQTALAYMMNTDKALEDEVDSYPIIEDQREAKIIPLLVTLLHRGTN